MTRPELKVEVAFNAGYSTPAASRNWTDITSYVLQMAGVASEHGRRNEYSVAEMNSLDALTLNNTDGRFTPGLTTSPYYPNVKLGRPIRVTVTPAGQAASVRFLGYVDQWPVDWSAVVKTYAECRITARSRLARLGRDTELRSIVEEEYLLGGPVAYYTLGEPEGATVAYEDAGNPDTALTVQQGAGSGGSIVFGTGTGPGTDGLPAVTFTAASDVSYKVLRGRPGVTTSATTLTLSAFFSATASVFNGIMARFDNGTTTPRMTVGVSDIGEVTGALAPAVGATLRSGTGFDDGNVHHAAIVATSGGTAFLYVDGVEVDSAACGAFSLTFDRLSIGDPFTGVISHVALFDSALSATHVADIANAGRTGFVGETPAARLTRYAAFAGVPAAETSFETGDVTNLAHIDTTGKTALACMREVETTEGGVLFDARDNTSTFHDRSHRYGATVAVTLDVAAGEVQPGYAPALDDVALRNDVTATGAAGVTARVVDAVSVADHGTYRESLELATTNPDEPFQAASWRVGNYAEPAVRVSTLTVELTRLSAARQSAVLALTVGDKITVANLPSQSDTASKTFFVEGNAETIGSATHTVVFNVSPAAIFEGVLILDHATSGQLDQERLAY